MHVDPPALPEALEVATNPANQPPPIDQVQAAGSGVLEGAGNLAGSVVEAAVSTAAEGIIDGLFSIFD